MLPILGLNLGKFLGCIRGDVDGCCEHTLDFFITHAPSSSDDDTVIVIIVVALVVMSGGGGSFVLLFVIVGVRANGGGLRRG